MWDFSSPSFSDLSDRGVSLSSDYLQNKKIAVLITASIAAYRVVEFVRELRKQGADVWVFASHESLEYVSKRSLEWVSLHAVIDSFSAESPHLCYDFDLYLVIPATYNSINKMANGIADNVVLTVFASALGRLESGQSQILVVPAMHGTMHNSILIESFHKLKGLGVSILKPRQENGKNNLPSFEIIIAQIIKLLTPQKFAKQTILITGGATPVFLDSIRKITTHFTGRLAIEIAKEAYFQGAEVILILGQHSDVPPAYLKYEQISSYQEYEQVVFQKLSSQPVDIGIFSAAVADYQPKQKIEGKMPSGQEWNIKMTPLPKVIAKVRQNFQKLKIVAFKYEESADFSELEVKAKESLKKGYSYLVANSGADHQKQGKQVAYIFNENLSYAKAVGKVEIAKALLNIL